MTAAERTDNPSFPRFASLIGQFFRRFVRSRPSERGAAQSGQEQPAPPNKLGELALAHFVHDIRNHLTVMMGCAESIFRLVPSGRADQDFADLQQCAERASRLSWHLLNAERARCATRNRVDLNQVVAPTMVRLSHVMGDRIELRLRLSAEPVPVAADDAELERILLNLALNARDAMPGGGVLTVETKMIADSPHPEGAGQGPYARLIVSDTGCGMPQEVKARIFEPFFTTKERGTGMGLSSVAVTVRQLRGVVSVDTQPGRGTTMTVHLPGADQSAKI